MSSDYLRMPLAELIEHSKTAEGLARLNERICEHLGHPQGVESNNRSHNRQQVLASTLPSFCVAAEEAAIAAEVLVEYHTPGSMFRADLVLIGCAPRRPRRPVIMTVELRDWSTLSEADRQSKRIAAAFPVRSYRRANTRRELRDPVDVATQHATLIRDYSGSLRPDATMLALAYLPLAGSGTVARLRRNWPEARDGALVSPACFGQNEQSNLVDFLQENFAQSGASSVSTQMADQYLSDRFRPTADLMQRAIGALDRSTEFGLTADQKRTLKDISDEVFRATAADRSFTDRVHRRNRPADKTLVVIHGRPGTGKTVIGVELLRNAWQQGWNARYASPSGAFNENMRQAFGAGDAAARDMFTSVRSLEAFEDSPLDLLIVDEAHRLPDVPWLHHANRQEREKRTSTVAEVLKAAKVVVCLLDESQQIRPHEVGDFQTLDSAARALGFLPVKSFVLTQTFRANGVQGYDDWVLTLLGMHSESNLPLDASYKRYSSATGGPFIFQTCDAGDLKRIVEEKRSILQEDGVRQGAGRRARVVAGYAWPWTHGTPDGPLANDVKTAGWSMPWNAWFTMTGKSSHIPHNRRWATDDNGDGQVGCIYTAQGFEFGWVGVLFGEDMVRRDGEWKTQPRKSHDPAIRTADPAEADRLIRSAYRVLMTRGLSGTVISSVDAETQQFFASYVEATS